MNVRNGAVTSSKAVASSMRSSISGDRPFCQAAVNAGAMINALKNKASETITIFGGDCCVPRAVRNNDSTITMRVNEVTVTKIPGASDSTVRTAISCTIRPVVDPSPSPKSRLKLCAMAVPARAVTASPASNMIIPQRR